METAKEYLILFAYPLETYTYEDVKPLPHEIGWHYQIYDLNPSNTLVCSIIHENDIRYEDYWEEVRKKLILQLNSTVVLAKNIKFIEVYNDAQDFAVDYFSDKPYGSFVCVVSASRTKHGDIMLHDMIEVE